MPSAIAAYEKLVAHLGTSAGVAAGQMFGKACIKVNGKAFVCQHRDTVVFKLTGAHHEKALALKGAALLDPSGKGRPMKEWVALPVAQSRHFSVFAEAALAYVAATA